MIAIFFLGIGASSILTAFAGSPIEIALGLTAIGLFAAIYHPVGLALVIQGRERTGVPLAINGIFGNLGVASAALLTGYLIDTAGWRSAFVLPGAVSIGIGGGYAAFLWSGRRSRTDRGGAGERGPDGGAAKTAAPGGGRDGPPPVERGTFARVLAVILFTTAVGGLVFQSTTFALPKVFDERLTGLAGSATAIGGYAFAVITVAAFAQLVVGYLVDRHSLRTVFAFVAALQAVFFAIMHQLTGLAALRRGGRVHARRVRADPDQRRAHRPDHEERVAKPRLRYPLRRDVLRQRLDPSPHRLDPRGLGVRPALRGDGGGRGRHPRGGPAPAAPGGVHRAIPCPRLTSPPAGSRADTPDSGRPRSLASRTTRPRAVPCPTDGAEVSARRRRLRRVTS